MKISTRERELSRTAVRSSRHPAPEFVDLTGLKSGWSIGRSLAYQLIEEGLLDSVNLRRDGCRRGKRLISVASIRKFFASFDGKIDPELSEQLRRARRGKTKLERRP